LLPHSENLDTLLGAFS